MFAESGYHATATTEIVTRAAMTRGALYHHFAGKEDLFAEVFRTVAQELVERSNSSVAPMAGDLWAKVSAAFRQYLHLVATHEEYQRILLIDGPAVLGWTRWRELQSEFVASGATAALELLMDRSLLARQQSVPAKMVLRAAYQQEGPSQWIAGKTGIPAVLLPYTVGGTPEAGDLFGLYDDTIKRLLKGMR